MSTLADLAPPGGWRPADERLMPLPREQQGAGLRLFLWLAGKWARRRTGSDRVPLVFLLMMRNKRLFRAWLRFASRFMPYGTIGRRNAELVILRVGWNCRCRYEWGQHVRIGRRVGLSVADIVRVTRGPEAEGWQETQALLLRAADELHADRVISEATWQALGEHYSPAQLIEITLLAGHYEMLAGLLNSAGLPLEPETEAELATLRIEGS